MGIEIKVTCDNCGAVMGDDGGYCIALIPQDEAEMEICDHGKGGMARAFRAILRINKIDLTKYTGHYCGKKCLIEALSKKIDEIGQPKDAAQERMVGICR